MAPAMLLTVPPGLLATALVPAAVPALSNRDATALVGAGTALLLVLGSLGVWSLERASRRGRKAPAAAATGGQVPRPSTRPTFASIEVGWMWPELTIRPENGATRAAKRAGLQDIRFESDTFNRMFQVLCADRRFASALIDAEMMDFLVSTQGTCAFEIGGRFAVAVPHRLGPGARLPDPGPLLDAFRERIPAIVYDLYPLPARPSPQPVDVRAEQDARRRDHEFYLRRAKRVGGWYAPLPGSNAWRDPNPETFGRAGESLGDGGRWEYSP